MKIIISGDYCPQNRVAKLFAKRKFDEVLGGIKPLLSSVDYSIVNFECPVTKGGEYPIVKMGPNLHCDESGVEALKWSGFDCVTLANNHFRDYGDEGVINSLAVFKKYDIDTVGGGISIKDASKILYKELDGQILAIINCCEHEFTIASDDKSGSNPLNPIQQYYAIKEARKKADFVVVIVHGGHEHYMLPSVRMQDTYRFFVDAGADAVVNHHQHCYSGFEMYKDKPIFYGLGNFCFDNPVYSKKSPEWINGYMLELEYLDGVINYCIHPYKQSSDSVAVKLLEKKCFDANINQLNSIIADKNKLMKAQDEYYANEKKAVLTVFQPFRSRFSFAARRFKLMPYFMSKKWHTALYNMLLCEAHRDKVEYFLEHN